MKSCYEIAFEEWLKNKTKLSDSSQYKYVAAIKGSISQRCLEYGVIKTNLLEVRNPVLFENIRKCLEGDERYITLNQTGNDMYKRSMDYFTEYLKDDLPSIDSSSIKGFKEAHPIITTEAVALINARKGQGVYRKSLEEYWESRCSITGTPDSNKGKLLIASHIKPWADSNNSERMDQFNGLLLIPNLDKAFDRGYITFDRSGAILISSQLNTPSGFGISKDLCITSNKLNQNHLRYLEYHRKKIFLSEC